MKLWLLRRTSRCGYDEWYAAVVAAETEEAARHIHPGTREFPALYEWGDERWNDTRAESWDPPEQLDVTYLGIAAGDISGCVCASYNAG